MLQWLDGAVIIGNGDHRRKERLRRIWAASEVLVRHLSRKL